jgi:hypothetical protein
MTDLISGTGVFLILLAFLLQQLERIKAKSYTYLLLNFLGSLLACAGSVLLGSYPFIILEGIWAAVSLYGIVKLKSINL